MLTIKADTVAARKALEQVRRGPPTVPASSWEPSPAIRVIIKANQAYLLWPKRMTAMAKELQEAEKEKLYKEMQK